MTNKEWQPPKNIPIHIVCAANRHTVTKDIMCAPRHWGSLMLQQYAWWCYLNPDLEGDWEQGFIDQWGRFHNRKEAMKIVKETGQKFDAKRNKGNGEDLYSEGLY